MIGNEELLQMEGKRSLWSGNAVLSGTLLLSIVILVPIVEFETINAFLGVAASFTTLCLVAFVLSMQRWWHWKKSIRENIGFREWMR